MVDLIISDLHADPSRQGGTTLESRVELNEWIIAKLGDVLSNIAHDRVIVVGDLTHKATVSDKVMKLLYEVFKNEKVIFVLGNHEKLDSRYGEISSIELLVSILPDAQLITEPTEIDEYYIIPHAFDQATFDKWVSECLENKKVFIHANLDNHWAIEPDHSLNLSATQAEELAGKGCEIFLGHEHTARVVGNVNVLGCLFPTSIADCLGGNKNAYIMTENSFYSVPTWSTEDFIEVDYENLDKIGNENFVRINGECEMVEFPKIVRDIAKLRNNSKAFIIANNVKVRKPGGETKMLEEVTQFNIVKLLLESIPEEFRKEVEACI